MRTDIIKIGTMQRPVPQTVRDLGEWEKCLWLQNYLAVLQARAAPSLSPPLSLSLRSPPCHPHPPLRISNHLDSTSVDSISAPTAQNSRAICSAAPPPRIAAPHRCCAAAALRR